MANAKLKFGGREITLGAGITTVGRASDNFVAFPEDSNVSRYHAEIEWRDGDGFYVIDLGSSNGTTVNGASVRNEKFLSDGDEIMFGGSSRAEFIQEKEKSDATSAAGGRFSDDAETADEDYEEFEEQEQTEIAEETEAASKPTALLGVAGAVCGLAVVFVFAAGFYYFTSAVPQCEAKAVITSPESDELIKTQTEIEVNAENTDCISRAVFILDDMILTSAESPPYFDASLDPEVFAGLADGRSHSLKLILEDEEGNQIGQPSEVFLNFDTIATPTPTPEKGDPDDDKPVTKPTPQEAEISVIDTKKMAENLVRQFPGSFSYKFDRRFLEEVRKKTVEYKNAEGYFQRANNYRDVINEAFFRDNNISPPLGFLLAMSRSKFKPEKTQTGEGLWQMPAAFVSANAYDGTCEVKDLSEPAQRCAAIAAAAYTKNIALNIFEGDTVYGVASFGMSPQEAAAWRDSLPANREDFWNVIKTPNQREEIVKFFAAGIVAENPQKFGLKQDQPISALYRNLIAQ